MNLTRLIPHLPERHRASFPATIDQLESAVAAGMVPNKLFTGSKSTINWCVEKAAEAFLATGPHNQKHHMSDWWLSAYNNDAFARGAHSLPTALKRAQKAGMVEYSLFLHSILPLQELLEAAKPLIKKRGDLPKVKTAKQIADEADQMTCQCCGRGIFAATGTIAHHGYERPGYGWQTASCMGAKRLPFEVDRAALGEMIGYLGDRLARAEMHRAEIKIEKLPIVFHYEAQLIGPTRHQQFRYGVQWPIAKHSFDVTRASFEAFWSGPGFNSTYGIYDFDAYKARHVEGLSRSIKDLRTHINEQQARYDGWKQTHKREGGKWVAL